MLIYLNGNVFLMLRSRRSNDGTNGNEESNAVKNEAASHAYILFAICAIYFATHVIRFSLNIHEFLHLVSDSNVRLLVFFAH